jgi:hypothetical protein
MELSVRKRDTGLLTRPASIHEDFGRAHRLPRLSDRSFGLAFAVVFLILGLFPMLRGGRMRGWALGVSGAFLLAAVVRPGLLGPVNTVWLQFNVIIRRILTPVLMGIVFYLVVTPMGMVMRLLRRDALGRRLEPAAGTYWIDHDHGDRDMRNQF